MTDRTTSATEITTKPLDPAARIRYIDGLRAIAVLMVVFFHCASYAPPVANGVLAHALREGYHGVDLFFILSGFCLSYAVLSRVADGRPVFFDFSNYAATRLVRILPPFWAGFAATAAIMAATAATGWVLPSPPVNPVHSVLDGVRQLSLIYPPNHGVFINGSFWTLAVEFRWYFAVPFLILLWVRSPRAFLALACACVVLFAITHRIFDVGSLPAFMLGIVAADAQIREHAWRRWAGPAAIAALVLAIFVESRGQAVQSHTQLPWQLTVFFFVVAAGYYGWLRRALSVVPLTLIGLVSYSIYLTHEPVIGLVEMRWGVPLIGGAVVAIAAGALFFLVFERPFVAGALRDGLRSAIVAMLRTPLRRAPAKQGITVPARTVA